MQLILPKIISEQQLSNGVRDYQGIHMPISRDCEQMWKNLNILIVLTFVNESFQFSKYICIALFVV